MASAAVAGMTRGDHTALVIGGGIAGLLAAHALSRQGIGVTVIERGSYDAMPREGAPPARAGVPQSQCLHMLMSGGAAVFDTVAPGWRDLLAASGAVPFDAMSDAATRFPAGWIARDRSGLTMHACSRALLERTLLDMLDMVPGVTVLAGAGVTGLIHDAARNRVTGVHLASGDALAAALVVDASGTASHMRKWLSALPGPAARMPEETVVPSPWQYVSQWWRLPPDPARDWACLSIAPSPGGPARAGMMLRAERDCWNVVLLAGAGERMPEDTAHLRAFAAEIGAGELARALASGAPLTPVHAYGRTANRFRHWDRLPDLPDGLAILGDAAMTLDPYRGLGMTAASISVQMLSKMLERNGLTQFHTCVFQRDLAQLQCWPWGIVTGHDRDGRRDDRLLRELGQLYELAPVRPEVARAVFECHHLVRPLERLPEEATQ